MKNKCPVCQKDIFINSFGKICSNHYIEDNIGVIQVFEDYTLYYYNNSDQTTLRRRCSIKEYVVSGKILNKNKILKLIGFL